MARKRHLLSYLAGVFDGEGCVSLSKGRRRKTGWSPQYRVHMRVAMADGVVPLLFQNVFGGGLHKRLPDGRRTLRTQYHWEITGHSCLPILKELLPYILIKRPQFEVAIHFLENTSKGGQGSRLLSDEELALREVDFILCRNLKKENISPALEKREVNHE